MLSVQISLGIWISLLEEEELVIWIVCDLALLVFPKSFERALFVFVLSLFGHRIFEIWKPIIDMLKVNEKSDG